MEQSILIQKLSPEERRQKEIDTWPIWEKEISRFDWHYDSDEECLILEGEVVVETPAGSVSIKPGDFVTFKQGLTCVWDVKKPIRKHYRFS
ncbi:MAG: cupin domain-containing protein [Bacteroidetes bacterium]|nr:cupin domain-containing protein [Bacteroidota bacterium]